MPWEVLKFPKTTFPPLDITNMYTVTVLWIQYLFTIKKDLGSGTYWLKFPIFSCFATETSLLWSYFQFLYISTCGSSPFLSSSGHAGQFNFTDTYRGLKNNSCALIVITTYRVSNNYLLKLLCELIPYNTLEFTWESQEEAERRRAGPSSSRKSTQVGHAYGKYAGNQVPLVLVLLERPVGVHAALFFPSNTV